MKRQKFLKWIFISAAFFALAALVAWVFYPKPTLLQGISFSQRVYDRQHHLLRLTLTLDDKYRVMTPLEEISPSLVEATLLHEDRYFYDHCGMNPVALGRAALHLFSGLGKKFGASTITMQLARARFHLQTRTIRGKIGQVLRAIQLERHYSKREILEAYFNLASYGKNIEGVGAASLIYFDKSPSQLTLLESLTLAVIPQSPTRRAPSHGSESAALVLARDGLFGQWSQKHPEDESKKSILQLGLKFRLPAKLPRLAPHFVEDVLRGNANHEIQTSLNLDLQGLLERQIHDYVREREKEGIHNVAALLLDDRKMEVLAAVGSASWWNRDIEGQINGMRVKRSPGSALKPFIYALAMEQGLIHPNSLLVDLPEGFSGYNPENFDRAFTGPIKARNALNQSRNIPAVDLLARLSGRSFYQFLKEAGVKDLKEESYYGLTLALGGEEVTMEEMAALYAALANGGRWKPLRKILNQKEEEGKQLLTPEACYLTLDILKEALRPQFNSSPSWSGLSLPVAWKTGTSFSFRDAWTAGVFDHYVLVVWAGNFDARGNGSLVGRSAAAPLFFRIVDAIQSWLPLEQIAHGTPWSPMGLRLKEVDLCEDSGELAGPHCPRIIKGLFIPGVSPIKTCDVHREIPVDPKTGLRLENGDATENARREVYEFWPSDFLESFRKAGIPRRLPPPFAPDSSLEAKGAGQGTGVRILSPRRGITYGYRAGEEASGISLEAAADAGVRKIYWFSDKTLLGTAEPGKALVMKAAAGQYLIRAVDDQGHSDERELHVVMSE